MIHQIKEEVKAGLSVPGVDEMPFHIIHDIWNNIYIMIMNGSKIPIRLLHMRIIK